MWYKPFLIALLLAGSAAAEELHITGFGGVNNAVDSYMISDTDAQDAANILTDEGDARPMPGAVQRYDVGLSSITFLAEMVTETGQHSLLLQSGQKLYSSSSTGGLVEFHDLGAVRDVDSVSAFMRMYFADGATPFYYDGASTATAPGMDSCRYVEFYANRLACVSISTDTSKVSLSKYNDPATWSITADSAESAVVKHFNKGDGQQIRCVKTTPYGLFIGKDTSAGLLKGDDADTFYWYDLSGDIGCVDDRSVQVKDGVLLWLSRNGIYGYSGRGTPELVSGEIRATTKEIKASGSSEQSWAVSSQAAWELGTTSGAWQTADGALAIPSYAAMAGMGATMGFAGEGGENGKSWLGSNDNSYGLTPYYGSRAMLFQANYPFVSMSLLNAVSSETIASVTPVEGAVGEWRRTSIDVSTDTAVVLKICNSFPTCATSPAFNGRYGAYIMHAKSNYNGYRLYDHAEAAAGVTDSTIVDTKIIGARYSSFASTTSGATVAFYTSADGTTWEGPVAGPSVGSDYWNRYYKFAVTYAGASSSVTAMGVSVPTATYYSPVYNVGSDIAGRKNFCVDVTESEVGLSSYQVRAASYAFAAAAASPAWGTQVNDTVVSASTAAYVQYAVLPNVATSTQSLSLASSVIGWVSGTVAPRVASVQNDGRYLICVSTASTEYNDICLLWMKNKKWMPIEGPVYASLGSFRYKPVAGDGTGGSKVWDILREDTYRYGSEPINTRWVSKDFALGRVNNHKFLERVWLTADNSSISTFEFGWQKDRDGVWVSSVTALNESPFVVKELDGLFLNEVPLGRQFRFKLSASVLDTWFRVKLYSIYYRVNELIK